MRARYAAAALLSVACAHPQMSGVPAPSTDHVVAPPTAPEQALEAAGIAHLLRALYFLSAGRPAAAIPYLKLALVYSPDSAYLHQLLVSAWAETGQPDEARAALSRGRARAPDDPHLALLAGRSALGEWRWPEAVELLRQALGDAETVAEARPALVDALLWLGRRPEALETAADVSRRDQADADLALRLGAVLEDHGELGGALAAYRASRRQRPSDRAATFGEVRVLDLLDRNSEAVEPLVSLFAFYPDAPELYVEITRVLRRIGSPEAQAHRDAALAQTVGDPHGRTIIASGDLLEGDIDAALSLLTQTVRDNPEAPEARLFLAELLQQMNDVDGCLEALHAPASQPDRYHRARAWCWASGRRAAETTSELEAALVAGHPGRDVLSDAARLLPRLYDEAEARRVFAELRQRAGEEVSQRDLLLAESQLEDSLGRGAQALARVEAAMELSADADVELRLADLEARYSAVDRAVARLGDLLKEAPDDPVRLNALGFTLADAKRELDAAEVWLRRAYRLTNEDGFVIDSLGWVLFQKGDYPTSLRLLERADRASPGDPEILRHLGDARRALGRLGDAKRAYEAALAARPGLQLRRLLEERLGALRGRES